MKRFFTLCHESAKGLLRYNSKKTSAGKAEVFLKILSWGLGFFRIVIKPFNGRFSWDNGFYGHWIKKVEVD